MGNQGSLCCAGRSKKVKQKELESEIGDKYGILEDLKTQSTELQARISPQDGELVQQRIRTTEKNFNDLKQRISRYAESYGSLGGSLDDIKDEARKYLQWLEESETQCKAETLYGCQPKDIEAVLTETRKLQTDLEKKQQILDGIIEKSQSLMSDLPSQERISIEQQVAMVQSQHNAVLAMVVDKCDKLQNNLSEREEFLTAVDRELSWLDERESTAKKMEVLHLLSNDVQKQFDKYKKLVSKVKSHTSNFDNLKKMADVIKDTCNKDGQWEIDGQVKEIKSRFDNFVQSLETQKTAFKDGVASRKSFEGDCHKIEKWCNELETTCSHKLPVDCAIELVEEEHKKYKSLSAEATVIGDLVKTTIQHGEELKPGLLGSDLPVLQQQLDHLRDIYSRSVSCIDEETKDLESKMEERYLLEKKIEESTIWLTQFQDELRLLSKTVPSSVQDAQQIQLQYQALEKKLAEYKLNLDELNVKVEDLRKSGQLHNVETIQLLSSQYEQFIDQISQYENNCEQAVFTRQQFENQTSTLETSLADVESEMQTANETEVSVSDRLERYKVISEKLLTAQPELVVAMDKAQQLKINQSTEDSEELKRVETIQVKLDTLKTLVEEKSLQYKTLQKENDDFNSEINQSISWLDEKDDILASCGTLDLDADKVHSVFKKHKKLSEKAVDKLLNMKDLTQKEKEHYEKIAEPLSNEMEEKLKQIESLETNIIGAISKKEEYLLEAIKDREQYKNSMGQVTDWIHGAEELLDSGFDGLEYDTIDQALSEYTDYFSEASLCQDEVEQITELSEKMNSTLDINDKQTLQQSLQNVNRKLSTILVNSQNKQQLLESKTVEWKQFLDGISEINGLMDSLETVWETLEQGSVNDPKLVQAQITYTQDFIDKLEENRPLIGELNDNSRSLERSANSNSRNIINGLMTNVNHRWSALITQSDSKMSNLKEISNQWEGFSGTISSIEDILHQAEVKLSDVNIDLITHPELVTQFTTLQDVNEMLSKLEPDITVMKKSSQTLQKALPTAEAKVHSQDTYRSLLEKYERLSSQACEQLQTVQEELDDRESFRSDLQGIKNWLETTYTNISEISPNLSSEGILKQIKIYEQEIQMKVDETKKLEKLQEGKYQTQGRELPEDLLIQLSSLRETEADVIEHLKQTSERLLHLKDDREDFGQTSIVVRNWLSRAEAELQQPIMDITESMAVHGTLLSSLDNFKEDLDRLHKKGGDIVRHTHDAPEKHQIQTNLANVNKQWNNVQSKIAEKSRKLNEALELHTTFKEATVTIKQWVDSASIEVGRDVTWSQFEDVRDDLKNTQRVAKDINQNKERLKSLQPVVKQLTQLIEPTDVTKTMATMTQQLDDLDSHTNTKLSTLQDVNKQVEAYEQDMRDVTRWLDHARTVLSSPDMSQDLKQELILSEKLLSDASSNKAKAQNIMEKYRELDVDVFPAHGSKILSELCHLEAEVSDRVEQLQTAVDEQEQYQTELSTLNTAVQQAQQKLLASPVMASSVEALKLQISEHDALAVEIKGYQERINSVNEKSRQLSERSRHHYPMFIRRRFFPDTSGHNILSAYNSPTYGSLPIISNAHFDSGIDSTGLTSSRYSDASVQPELSWSNVSDKSTNTIKSTTASKLSQSENVLSSRDTESATSLYSPVSPVDRVVVPPLDLTDRLDTSEYLQIQSDRGLKPSDLRHLRFEKPKFATDDKMTKIPQGPELPAVSNKDRSSSVNDLKPEEDNQLQGLKPEDDNQLQELNTSWNNLQQQANAKEKELLSALEKQEAYQKSVQDITNKMEKVHAYLFNHQINYIDSLDDQVTDHKSILEDIQVIKLDLDCVRDYGIFIEASDPEGYKTVKSTLNMLTDKVDNIQDMATERDTALQNAVEDMSNHKLSLEKYKEDISEIDNWCRDMMVEHSESALPTDTLQQLHLQLDSNKTLQDNINDKLHDISDLAVQCDKLCTMERPISAEKLRSQLALLQNQLSDFKLATIEKQSSLRQTIKEAEKRERELSDYDRNMKHLQQWMTDSKQMTLPPDNLDEITALIPEQVQLQKDLVSGITEHRLLLTDITDSGQKLQENYQESVEPSHVDPSEELQTRWENLEKDLQLKKQNLEDSIKIKQTEVRRSSIQYRPWTYSQDTVTTTELSDIQRIITDLNTSWSELSKQTDEKQLRLDQALAFQQLYQNAILSISGWLDSAEQKLFSADLTKSTDEQMAENEQLQTEIQGLQKEILKMNNQAQDLLSVSSAQHGQLIQHSLSNLNNRVAMLESHAQDQAVELQEVNSKWKKYQTDVAKCKEKLADTQTFVSHHSPSWSMEDLAAQIQRVESDLEVCDNQIQDIKYQEKELAGSFPHGVFPSELNTLQHSYMDIQRKLTTRKSELQQSASIQQQYESLLVDYSEFLETAESKLKTGSISGQHLAHLKQQLTAHKDFFSDLENHKAMLDLLREQCDKTLQEHHHLEHTRLTNLTHVIVDQASLHGQRLERLVKQWSELEEKYLKLQKTLDQIEKDIPKPISSGDSLKTIEEKLQTLLRLQQSLSNEKASVFQVVDLGKQILHNVTCPKLEASISELADKWVELNTQLSQELKRTETVGDQLQRFEAEASILASWLATANTKVISLQRLSKKEKKTIAGVRGKVEKLLEFQKEVENQVPLKKKVLTVGSQLLNDKTFNTTGLSDRLKQYEHDWEKLQTDIADAEKYLHKEQMARMPSRQALQELEDWLGVIKQALHDDPHRTVKSASDVDYMLRKYKDFKVELASKQISVDFVNQSILQPQEEEGETEKVAFAEKLGDLNNQWQIVTAKVNKRLDFLEQLQTQWERFEQAFTALEKWFIEQNNKLDHYKNTSHEVGVQETRTDCKAIKQALKFKETEISKFKDQGDRLMELCHDSPGIQRSIQHNVNYINTELVKLDKQLIELDNIVEDRTGQWSHYQSELHALQTILSQAEYCLNNYRHIGGDLSTLRNQLDKLKLRESEMIHTRPQLDDFIKLSNDYATTCDPHVKTELHNTCTDIQQRWEKTLKELKERQRLFDDSLSVWQVYEDKYTTLRNWLDDKERECNHIKTNMDENKSVTIETCKNLQLELDNIQVKLTDLYQLSDSLTRNMDQSTISVLASRQTLLEQRLVSLRQQLSHHMTSLRDDDTLMNDFYHAYGLVKTFLSHAESILAANDPIQSADELILETRLDQLKDLQMLFNDNMINLDTVNNLGYRLALKPVDASRMQDLNHKWYRLLSETSMRCKMLQGHVVVQQDFTVKCENWKSFLGEVENDLSVDSAGNLADLLQQQVKCEKFNADKYSREQVLHGILSDGQQLLRTGDVGDADLFQQKLHLLAEQWQSVVRRANQRKDIIDSTINQWQLFNDLSEKLRNWLADKDHSLENINYNNISLLQVKNLLTDINVTKDQFKLKEQDFKRIHELGNILLQPADLTASKEIKVCLAQLEHSWYQVYSQLEEHRIRLEDLVKQWQECEDDLDDILGWLKETRQTLNKDMSENYDEIQRDINRCKDIETAFSKSDNKRQKLLSTEAALALVIQSEDMNVLHQRIRLLNKQWEELSRQVTLRLDRLDGNTGRWTIFSERVRWFLEWMNEMEERVIGGKDIQVEDLIQKLDTEINEEMSEKERIKGGIIEEGKQLMSNSSDIRSSDIESKSERVENKWQHLRHVVSFRQRKLQETVLAVKQLDNSMKNLGKWLTNLEEELNSPIVYSTSDMGEIQKHFEHQQDLQRDIERHSAGVASVLNLCQVLLHDTDACPTEVEFNALQTTMESLDRRWKNICQQSPQRRIQIEDTWKIWEKFRKGTDQFSDWLDEAEAEIRRRETNPMALSSKEEMMKLENLQKNIRSHITQLENINKQYRSIAKAGLTDTKGVLKSLMQEVNDRWDRLQERSLATVKDLRKSNNTREEYNLLRTELVTRLRETEIQVTDIEHLSQLDNSTKLDEIKRLESECDMKKLDNSRLEDLAAVLRLQGDGNQNKLVQSEMEEYRDYYRDVTDRIKMNKKQLEQIANLEIEDVTRTINDRPQTIQVREESGRYMSMETHSRQIPSSKETTMQWDTTETEEYLRSSPPESPKRRRTSGRRTPRSARSPSRWAKYAEADGEEKWRRMRVDMLKRGRSNKVEELLETLADSIEDADTKLSAAERELQTSQALGQIDRTERFIYYMDECEVAIDQIQALDRLIKTESGLNTISSADAHIKNLTERWERLQEGTSPSQIHRPSDRPDQRQFIQDLDSMLDWLEEAEALQSSLLPLPDDMGDLESIIRQFKDFLVQLEAKKTRVLSINLISRSYIDSKTHEGRELRDKLHVMNKRFEQVCSRVNDIQQELQSALTDSTEFHHTVHDLLLWLERVENRIQQCEPINVDAEDSVLWEKYTTLKDLQGELERNQDKAMTLKETADQLLLNSDSTEMVNAKDKTHIIANRLRALLRLCNSYISSLESKLELKERLAGANLDESDRSSGFGSARGSRTSTSYYTQTHPPGSLIRTRNRSPFAVSRQLLFGDTRPLLQASVEDSPKLNIVCHEEDTDLICATPFCSRVLRAALPFQLLMLLLLGLACLVPICEDDYSCGITNNMQRMIDLMVRYMDGPPPV